MEELLAEEQLHKKTPEELTTLLYNSCIENLEQAKLEISNANYQNANIFLQKANDILYRLGAGINYEAGPVSDQLEIMYNYMAEKLIQANITKSNILIDEVLGIIRIINDAWVEAMTKVSEGTNLNVKVKNKVSAYDQDYTNSYNDVNLKK